MLKSRQVREIEMYNPEAREAIIRHLEDHERGEFFSNRKEKQIRQP